MKGLILMNDLKVFKNTEFGELGVLTIDGKEWFPATQCARVLGYANTRDAIKRHCKTDGVVKHDGVSYTTNQHGVTTEQLTEIKYINEGNLYRLIVSSKLPAAEKFERWVFDEVLPEIRRNGSYGNSASSINIEEIIAKTATAVVSEVCKQLVPLITNAVLNKPIDNTKKAVRKKTAKIFYQKTPCKMDMLPPDVKETADEMLISGEYSAQQVANYIINATGEYISQVAISKYKRNNFVLEDNQLSLFGGV